MSERDIFEKREREMRRWESLPSAVFTLSLWALKTLSISVGAIVPSKPTGIPFTFIGYGAIGVVGVGGADDVPIGDCNCLISIFIRKSSAPACL